MARASALDLPYADHAFDFVLCQFGLQFFPDRPTALREMHRTLAPGGLLAASVFGPIEHNPATYALANALDRHLGPGSSVVKRAEHALADPIELRALVTSERFRDATVMTRTLTVRFRSAQEYVAVQLTATPLAALASSVDPPTRDRLVGDVGRALAPYAGETGLAFPQEVHVVLARA